MQPLKEDPVVTSTQEKEKEIGEGHECLGRTEAIETSYLNLGFDPNEEDTLLEEDV